MASHNDSIADARARIEKVTDGTEPYEITVEYRPILGDRFRVRVGDGQEIPGDHLDDVCGMALESYQRS